jgi:hypothetical protein
VRDAVCFSVGTLIDQWLFWQTRTQGAFHTAAKFIAVWKSAWLVAPSPQNPTEMAPLFFARIAHAAPTACGSCGPMHDDQLTWFTARPDWWLGICRPFCTSPELPNTCATNARSGNPRTSMTLCSRSAGNTQSPFSTTRPVAMGTASCPWAAP